MLSADCQRVRSLTRNVNEQFNQTDLLFLSIKELNEVFEFIEANYNKGITLCDAARVVGCSPAYLTNKVKREEHTVNRWIIERHIAQARFLLDTTNQSVEQIATAVGYQNTCHFFRQFCQVRGTTPQAWRNKHLRSNYKSSIKLSYS